MKIGIIQYSPEWENNIKSAEKIDNILSGTLPETKILIFPEMTLTGFTMNSDKFAEEIDGFSTTYFMKKSQELRTHIFAGIIERDGGKIYNSLVHFDDTGLIISRYRKIHLFDLAEEDKNYSAGKNIVITKVNNVKIGLSICYDLRFPELYRFYAKQKVDIIVNIANWPIQRIHHWQVLLQAHSIANQCFTIGVNRVGEDTKETYNGNSLIYNPMGIEMLKIVNEEGLFYFNLNMDEVHSTREKLPFLNNLKLI